MAKRKKLKSKEQIEHEQSLKIFVTDSFQGVYPFALHWQSLDASERVDFYRQLEADKDVMKDLYLGFSALHMWEHIDFAEIQKVSGVSPESFDYFAIRELWWKVIEFNDYWVQPFNKQRRAEDTKTIEERRFNYNDYLKSPHWGRTKQFALRNAGYKCQVCSVESGLQVHHNTYIHIWYELPKDLIVLCAACHNIFHKNGKLKDYINE